MRKYILALLLCAASLSYAQSSFVTISASKLYAGGSHLVRAGKLCATATDASDQPLSIGVQGGGIVLPLSACSTISNGAATLQVADPRTASLNAEYRITVFDADSQRTSIYSRVVVDGSWCTGTTCSLDSYDPTTSVPMIVPDITLGSADATGTKDVSSRVNAAIAAQVGSYLGSSASFTLPPGQFWVPSLSNVYGVPFTGPGRLLKTVNQTSLNSSNATVTATTAQANSYAYATPRLVFGQEYMSHWMANIQGGAATKVLFSGDSTTQGVNITNNAYLVDKLFAASASSAGLVNITTSNSGQSGKDTADWVSTFLASDLATSPDVYVVRWGINDPFWGLTPAQTIANIRSGLATIRASKNVDQMTVVLEMPSAVNDNPNGRGATYYEQLRNGYAQAARDYQAVFIDLYGLMPDNDFAVQTCMMDQPFAGTSTPPVHIHPGNCKNPIYNDILAKTLIDPVRVWGSSSSTPTGSFTGPVSTNYPGSGVFMGANPTYGPTQVFYNSLAGTDNKLWQFYPDTAGTFNLWMVNDASNAVTTVLAIPRSGINPQPMRINDDLQVSGTISAGGGAIAVYRCTTAGTLPVGALTVDGSTCGASTDTGLRVK
ncbi:MAG TPA: SGNH/GDSL hydrolase family protein [Acidisarcina sp.]|nr:SGNH/GDSL hydrolase family protein [Acidisarcina sp.]